MLINQVHEKNKENFKGVGGVMCLEENQWVFQKWMLTGHSNPIYWGVSMSLWKYINVSNHIMACYIYFKNQSKGPAITISSMRNSHKVIWYGQTCAFNCRVRKETYLIRKKGFSWFASHEIKERWLGHKRHRHFCLSVNPLRPARNI